MLIIVNFSSKLVTAKLQISVASICAIFIQKEAVHQDFREQNPAIK
jgi:hypothetical protein